ncbi:MAG: nodulation protein NfeD, partial [Candidatus Zixiibacteriota bacterium]
MGAKAGSAGVYMTYSAHFAAMAPASNIGAAHPVAGGGQEIDSVMNEKMTNDAVAQIRSAAEKWGRNAEWAEKSVRESASITATEALEMNVVDFIAEDLDDLLRQIDGRETETPYGKQTMNLSRYVTDRIEPTFAQKFLEVITDPNIIFILFSIGGLGIVLELYNPGSILPGVVGAISLILAFYASSTLPINYAGVALIFLAIILWIAEIKIVSHGLLTVGGIISFFLGGLMLVDTVDPELKVSLSLLITMVIVVGVVVAIVGWLVIRAHRGQPAIGNEGMIGKKAEVRKAGFVFVNGALWEAECDQELEAGEKVEIVGVDGLILKVKKINS